MRRFASNLLSLVTRMVPYRLFYRGWAALLRRYLQRVDPANALNIAQDAFEIIDEMGSRAAAGLVDNLEAEHWKSQSFRFFVEHLSGANLILHLGCGQGSLSYDLATQCDGDVLACSASNTDIDAAQKYYRHQNLRFIHKSELLQLEPRADILILTDWIDEMPNISEWPLEKLISPKSRLIVQLHDFPGHWWRADAAVATSSCVEVAPNIVLSDLKQSGWIAVGQWSCFGASFIRYHRR